MLLSSESPSESSSESSPELSKEDTQGLLLEGGTSSASAGWSLADSSSLKNGQSPTLALRSSCFSQWKSVALERLFCSAESEAAAWFWHRDKLDHNPFARCSATSLSTLLLSSNPCSGPREVSAGPERSASSWLSGQLALCPNSWLQSAATDELSGQEAAVPQSIPAAPQSIPAAPQSIPAAPQSIPAARLSTLCSPFSGCFWGFIPPTLASGHARPQSAKLNSAWAHTSPISKMSRSQNVEARFSLLGSGHGRGNMGHADGNSRDMDGIWGPQFSKQKASSPLFTGKSIAWSPVKGAEEGATGGVAPPPSATESRAGQQPRRPASCGFWPLENLGSKKSKHADSKVWKPKNSALLWIAWMFSLVNGSLDV